MFDVFDLLEFAVVYLDAHLNDDVMAMRGGLMVRKLWDKRSNIFRLSV